MQNGYGSTARHMGGINKPLLSPRQETKKKRQQAREIEVAKQEEEKRKKMEQEEKERQWQQEQRMGRDFQFSSNGANARYASSANPFEITNGYGDMNNVGKFEAMHMLNSAKPRTHHASSSSSQNDEPSPRKWTPRHSRHSSLDETPMGGTHRPERSDSIHLYTTYEHRTHM